MTAGKNWKDFDFCFVVLLLYKTVLFLNKKHNNVCKFYTFLCMKKQYVL